jgi:UDP:flavonoid glycosyltransferase YjiC (YdhE family)
MSHILVVATAGAGGDLQPLMAASFALRDRGHDVALLGDGSVQRSAEPLGLRVDTLPPELDLGPTLMAAIRDAMTTTGGDLAKAGPLVQQRLGEWAEKAAQPLAEAIQRLHPALVVTSLFGVEVLGNAEPPCPWAVVNSTFYFGPGAPRPIEQDVGPRAVPILARYAALLEAPDLVLHATDQQFDFGFDGLPVRHHYVGPLGIWEPRREREPFLDEPGDPWVLVSISSQMQDDVPIAAAALEALANRPVRVVVTVGPDHDPGELGVPPPNARVERTVSHAAVLERGILLVSHAGHGSAMKALWSGRPMVLVPWGRDQPGVAARAEALGVAHIVPREEASADRLSSAIDMALEDQGMRDSARAHSERLAATNPPAAAAAHLEALL